MKHRIDLSMFARLDSLYEIRTPSLWVHLDAVEHNVRAMAERVSDPRRWRPHIKTHKQAAVLERSMRAGIVRYKCATLDELSLIAQVGRSCACIDKIDVLFAYPLHRLALRTALDRVCQWQSSDRPRVSWLADAPEHLDMLVTEFQTQGLVQSVFLDVDVGMGRTGSAAETWRKDREKLRAIFQSERASVRLLGLHGYDGHIRWNEREKAFAAYGELMELASALQMMSPSTQLEVITSGTHSYHHALAFAHQNQPDFDLQVSPGTILFSDLRSQGAATDLGLRQAAFVATRVIHCGNGRVTLDAGSKAINPDVGPPHCEVVGYPGWKAVAASEEHLVFDIPPDESVELGALLWLVPAHVCTTVNLYDHALYIEDGQYTGRGAIVRGHASSEEVAMRSASSSEVS